MKYLLVFVLLLSFLDIQAAPRTVYSDFNLRITHRRFIQHIVFENIAGEEYLTVLLSHGPNYHAFKDIPHALHFKCISHSKCFFTARKIDEHLQSGQILSLRLKGSEIIKIEYLNAGS